MDTENKITENQPLTPTETESLTEQKEPVIVDNKKPLTPPTTETDKKPLTEEKKPDSVDDKKSATQTEKKAVVAEEKKPVTQDEVLLASLTLFAEKGFFNTSLTDIKNATGIKTTHGIYQHFKNKQAIAEALYSNILDSLSISIDDIRRRNRKASEQLREIVDLLFKLTDEAPDLVRFFLVINIKEILPEQKPLLETAPFNKIRRVIQNGIRDEEIRSLDPLLAYSYFFGIINHTLKLVLSGDLPKQADSYQSQVWLAAWGSIAKK